MPRPEAADGDGMDSHATPARKTRTPEHENHRNADHEKRPEMSNGSQHKSTGISLGNSYGILGNSRVINYNIPEGKRPGGIRVRFKIRVITGKRAAEIDARQARAILEVLQWQRQHHPPA
jgi:hypothetical protein